MSGLSDRLASLKKSDVNSKLASVVNMLHGVGISDVTVGNEGNVVTVKFALGKDVTEAQVKNFVDMINSKVHPAK